MLTSAGCSARRRRLWDALPVPCDALLISDPRHLIYFANYAPSPFEFRAAEAAALLVLTPDAATLVADNLVQPYLDASHVDRVVAPVWYQGKAAAGHRGGLLVRSTLSVLADIAGSRIGLEAATAPAGVIEGLRWSRPGLEVLDLDPIIRPLRRAKDADELALLGRSMRAGSAAQAAALEGIEPGMTELDAFLLVQRAALEAAGEPALVYGDFVSGPRCEGIGGPPTSRVIARGDLFLLDLSVVLHGYRGDFANTFVVGGPPSDRQRELFAVCLDALSAGEATLRAGVKARDVDAAVRGSFARRGNDVHFPSHSGHGLGLGHPEPPFLVPDSDETLVEGDVVALEPGQYVAGVGGMRFERNYLVKSGGFEVLSEHHLAIDPREAR